jgi:lysozyme
MNKDVLREQLAVHEGKRLDAYICPGGYLTVGVGHNVEANPVGSLIGREINQIGDTINESESDALLDHDIDRFADEVRQNFDFFDTLSEPRQHVLVDMAFNMGTAGMLKFRNMVAALQEGDFDRAATEMLDSRWARQVGRRSQNLSEMMRQDVELSALA